MKHTYKTPHSFDGENDFELSILYNYSPGAPQLGPSYSSGGEPAESPEIDVLGVMVNDRAATPEQWDQVVENERLYNEMALNAADYIAAAAAEYRAEKRMNNMLAYHNDPAIKSKLLADLQAHADADLLIKGQYWQNGKGCAVGCTLNSLGEKNTSDHAEYETRLGIPQMLARLEDTIFEGLPNTDAMQWPMRFSAAINPGADLSRVGWKWLHWLLIDGLPRVNDAEVTAAIKQCAEVLLPLTRGEPVDRDAAYAAADAARAAARAAVYADDAARAAARAAVYADDAAARAAGTAVYAARAAVYAADAADAAYQCMADKLVQLLEDAE